VSTEETGQSEEPLEAGEITEEQTESQASTVAAPSDQETPATSQAPSEAGEQPVTPSSVVQNTPASSHARTPTRPVVPIIPKVPVATARKPSSASQSSRAKEPALGDVVASPPTSEAAKSSDTAVQDAASAQAEEVTAAPAPKALPKSWADLVRTKAAPTSISPSSLPNGVVSSDRIGASKAGTLAESIRAFTVNSAEKIPFIKPRGLVNTGNMCYMNSVGAGYGAFLNDG
jgi:ubiquitin carboxyl-terminal hydrolase 10